MHVLIVAARRTDRIRAAAAHEPPGSLPSFARLTLDASVLPFVRADAAHLPDDRPRVLRLDDIENAFPNHQVGGTRLILTQSTYTLQTWLDLLGPNDRIIATADPEGLARAAPEAFQRRGPWRLFTVVANDDADDEPDGQHNGQQSAGRGIDVPPPVLSAVESALARAYGSSSANERVTLCRQTLADAPGSPVAALGLASALREVQDLEAARSALDRALALAPDWAAAHYEDGKFWLGLDDMERARDAFRRTGVLMPTFSAAFSNLGATLGELDEPEAAAAAFARAADHDPESFTLLNNIGVVNRELGRLDESEAALTRVTALAPGFVFGHYNLGHTRFLKGDYPGALVAYEEGQRRDPEKNRRQTCRLALVRFATGDVEGADRDLWRAAEAATPAEREDLLLEAYEIAQALVRSDPRFAVHRRFLDRIAEALADGTS